MKATVFVQDVFRISGLGVIPVGSVKSGVLRTGMKLNIAGRIMTVKSIEMHHRQVTEAHAGDNIGFSLENGDYGLIKSACGQDVTFSDDAAVVTRVIKKPEPVIIPEPIHPKGFFDSIIDFFRNIKGRFE